MQPTEQSEEMLPSVHPGDVLREDYLAPLGKTRYWLAKRLGISPTSVGEILAGHRSVTAATALRLSRLFGCSAQFWMNLQSQYDLEQAERRMTDVLDRIAPCDPALSNAGAV